MSLSEQARERLADVVALQPTKNRELQERWGMESGSEVHQYLESELEAYYYRDDNSLIRATDEAAALVGVETGGEDDDGRRVVHLPPIQVHVFDVIAGPDEEPESVVSVLHGLRDVGHDAEVADVRSALRSLVDRGLAEVVRKTVPTYRLAVSPDEVVVEPLEVEA